MSGFRLHYLFFLPFLIILSLTSVNGQDVDCSRTATIQDGVYKISGTAILERMTDQKLQLRLDDDFQSEVGPDVQIFLSNDSTSTAGGVMIADIGTTDGLNHFSGAITFDVPGDVAIGAYDYLVFRCVTFSAFWGGGKWGEASCSDPGGGGNNGGGDTTMMSMLCVESLTATTNWASEVTICPNDGESDVVPLLNNIGATPGMDYAYVLVNDNNIIKEVIFDAEYDFEGSSLETEYIFGVHYRGQLDYTIGNSISTITADTCAMVSDPNVFLTIYKMNCQTEFSCVETATATTNWESVVTICPGDGNADVIPFLNNQFEEPGSNYAYLITDSLDRLIEVHLFDSYDFESSGPDENRVYGISYSGNLNAQIGQNIQSITADSCFQLSDPRLFLTVLKGDCTPELVSVSGKITTPSGQAVSGVNVSLDIGRSTKTNAQGEYSFEDLEANQTYVVEATINGSAGNGISATDLVLTVRHILASGPLSNPYQLIAADVNANGSISSTDLAQMRGVLIGLLSEFDNNTSWIFIDANQTFNGNVLQTTLIKKMSIDVSESNVEDVDFFAIKIGDVNNSATVEFNN